MKKILSAIFILALVVNGNAKKVKFSVNMSAQLVSTNGIHIGGDFQTIAGFAGGDFNSGSTLLSQEDSSGIYSIVVDVPAFAKYEYKFINGNQWYEAEFIPFESRVGYNFNDNRWIYVDSLADDTTDIGAVVFAGNAPAGKVLGRFLVDITNASQGEVHLTGDFTGWNQDLGILYSFGNNVYENIFFLDTVSYEYKFAINGNSETLPSSCSSAAGNRQIAMTADYVAPQVCFNDCSGCILGINEIRKEVLNAYPNPSSDVSYINTGNTKPYTVAITDYTGKLVSTFKGSGIIAVEKSKLTSGIYTVTLTSDKEILTGRIIFN